MARFELRADYDGDGVVSSGDAEYGRRQSSSGAKIVPNLDRDDRKLPTSAAATGKPTLDWALTAKSGQDNEPALLRVRAVEPMPPGSTLVLRTSGELGGFVRLSDNYGRNIAMEGYADFPLAMSGAETEFWVDTFVFAASPLLESPSAAANPRELQLRLIGTEAGMAPVTLDTGVFEVPRLFILDDLAPAERLYIAEAVKEENEGSIRDVEAVAAKARVPVVRVPVDVNMGDLWMQDQFQLAWCRTPKGPRRFLLHLPRLRANSTVLGISANLAPFVAQHFPSKDLGLIEDFWKRQFEITDVRGVKEWMQFEDSQVPYLEMGRIFRTRLMLLQTASDLVRRLNLPDSDGEKRELASYVEAGKVGVIDAMGQIPLLQSLASSLLRRAATAATTPAAAAALRAQRSALPARVASAMGSLRQPRPEVLALPVSPNKKVEIDATEADRLFDRLEIVHDSLNFGGNLECSPPLPSATMGKIVIGHTGADGCKADPDLLVYLAGQGAQPVVTVDTSWLKVGHVDEMMSFVPHASSPSGFATVRASSLLGIQLLRNALIVYRNDLSVSDDHQPGRTIPPAGRLTTRGKHPVTMMLRGRYWRHIHPVGAFEPNEPPEIFREHSALLQPNVSGTAASDLYRPGPFAATADDKVGVRHYPAAMSLIEFEIAQSAGNDAIEERFLAPLGAQLGSAFPGVPALRVPVLYDDPRRLPVGDGTFEHDFRRSVGAFLPNAANMQVLGNTVLVPKPYGPRMRPDHAGPVIRASLAQTWPDFKVPRLDAHWFASRGLDEVRLWVRAEKYNQMAGNASAVAALAKWFQDGFAAGTALADIEKQIRLANPRALDADGSLKTGWQQVTIPEKTVDLFEACTVAVLQSAGVDVVFVDSWLYHIQAGEIHCGTNVLRSVRKG